jgi:hypothetical protein
MRAVSVAHSGIYRVLGGHFAMSGEPAPNEDGRAVSIEALASGFCCANIGVGIAERGGV